MRSQIAASIDEIQRILSEAGFEAIRVTPKNSDHGKPAAWQPGGDITDYTVSAIVEAVKPGA